VLQVIPAGNCCTIQLSGLTSVACDCFKVGNGGPTAEVAFMLDGEMIGFLCRLP